MPCGMRWGNVWSDSTIKKGRNENPSNMHTPTLVYTSCVDGTSLDTPFSNTSFFMNTILSAAIVAFEIPYITTAKDNTTNRNAYM